MTSQFSLRLQFRPHASLNAPLYDASANSSQICISKISNIPCNIIFHIFLFGTIKQTKNLIWHIFYQIKKKSHLKTQSKHNSITNYNKIEPLPKLTSECPKTHSCSSRTHSSILNDKLHTIISVKIPTTQTNDYEKQSQ